MSIYTKIAQELKSPFYDENDRSEVTYDMFSRNLNVLKRYQTQIARYFSIIKSRTWFDPNLDMGEDLDNIIKFYDQSNYNLNAVIKLNKNKINLEESQEKDESIKSAIEAISSILSKTRNSLEVVKIYNKHIKTHTKYEGEDVTFSDQNALYKKPTTSSKLDQLINKVNNYAQKLGGNNLSFNSFKDDSYNENGVPNPNSKRRQLLNAINADAKQLLDAIQELYSYTESTKQEVGKKTWTAKNYLGLIRSFVTAKEFQDMNNMSKSLQLLYNIK